MRWLISTLLLCCMAAPVHAALLWEQLPLAGSSSYIDQEFPDFPSFSTYQVHDITVGANGWIINSVTGFFSFDELSWPTTASARLNLFEKTEASPMPWDEPQFGSVVTGVFNATGPTLGEFVVSGLNVSLDPGNYWIGMTPIVPFTGAGQGFRQVSAQVIGDYSMLRNPSGSFGFGTSWTGYEALTGNAVAGDGALRIEGENAGPGPEVPEPGSLALLSLGLGAVLATIRRRR